MTDLALAAVALVGLIAIAALGVLAVVWLWRDMRARGRPRWFRIVLLALTLFPVPIWVVILGIDLQRHPHSPPISLRQMLTQPFARTTPPT